MNSDFKDLSKLFNASKVRYPVVGGHAVMKYTEPRYTKDLDIWIEAISEKCPCGLPIAARFRRTH